MVWVKFHDKLCKGAKRGLPRAVRFVFMELCLESRPGRGVLDLPVGMSDLDALHDVLGGNRKELAESLKVLAMVPKPTADDPEPRAMVELTGDEGTRRLTIPSWEAWNSGQETPGASTERSRRYRQRTGGAAPNTVQRPTETDVRNGGDDDATPMQRPLHALPTETQREGNGPATQYRGEERRGDQKRAEEIGSTHIACAPARDEGPVPVVAHRERVERAEPGPPPEGWAEIASAEALLGAVARHPMLATLHGDRRWATAASGGLQAAACRAEDARAAVDAFVTGESGKAPEDEAALGRWVRENIGRYLKRAKQCGDEERRRARERVDRAPVVGFSPTPGPANAGPLGAFAGAWQASKGRAYVSAASDAPKAERLALQLREQGRDPEAVILQVARGYLADEDPLVAGSQHPFALFVSRFNQYDAGDPAPAAAPRPLPEPPPPRPVRRMTVEQQQAHQASILERLRAEERAKAG